MNKEKIITISIGLLVGILVTGGYFVAAKLLPAMKKNSDNLLVQPKPVVTPGQENPAVSGINSLQLSLDSPADHSSTSEATLAVSGQTLPGATLILFGNNDEKVASADASGKFSIPLKLEEGENEISLTAFADKANSEVIHRNITLEVSQ